MTIAQPTRDLERLPRGLGELRKLRGAMAMVRRELRRNFRTPSVLFYFDT
jgi:hypothetical protein